VDKAKVWSVSCFFVEKKARGRGLTVAVLNAAAEFARSRGAKILEGYPQELKEKLPPAFVWTGVMPTFVHAGFREAERRSPKKPIMRMVVAKAKSKVKSEAKSNYPTLRPKDGRKGRAPGAAKTAAKKSGAKTQ
jgi:hypothetical protein